MTITLSMLSSCKHDYSIEISQLDSTKASLAEAQKDLAKTNNADSIAMDFLNRSMEEITKSLPSDTVDKNTGLLLSEIAELKRNFTSSLENKTNFHKASEVSLARIKNLQHDLERNLIEENKAPGYIVTEIETSKKIIETMGQITAKNELSLSRFDSLKPKITLMIDSLKLK